jgi:5-methylcytosine-specific restriction endonuclease McrBC regulatory subunit McrC
VRRVAVHEYTRLYRGSADVMTGTHRGGRLYLSDVHFRRLRNYDEARAKSEHYQIFDWRRRYAIAQQWVGVIQVPGLSVEILPKIAPRACEEKPDKQTEFSRKNLLYMLLLAGKLPIRERDLADQSAAKAPLLETLIAIFAERLFFELNRGRQHNYIRRRENLPVLKALVFV